MTLEDLSTQISVSPQMLGAMERGKRRTKKDIAAELESSLATNGALLRKWEEARKSSANPEWHTDVVQAEEDATEIHYFHPTLIPGLFQTEEYARVIFADGRPLDSREDVDRLTQLRTQRLTALMEKTAPKITGLIGEGALRARVGGTETMDAQLAHLENLAKSSATRLLVVPSTARYHGGASGPFQVLRFADRPTAIYADHAGGGTFIDTEQEVQRFTAILQELLAWALSPTLTLELLGEVRREAK